jgi:predicted Fe-Mo cluster-binding NifX family protein
MRLAFTTSGNTPDNTLDPRFGRAARFLIHDTETQSWEVVDNLVNLNAAQGAGIQSAETLSRQNVDAVVTGHCGPKAFKVLSAAGIKIYPCDSLTVREALQRLQAGELPEMRSADVEGHWA